MSIQPPTQREALGLSGALEPPPGLYRAPRRSSAWILTTGVFAAATVILAFLWFQGSAELSRSEDTLSATRERLVDAEREGASAKDDVETLTGTISGLKAEVRRDDAALRDGEKCFQLLSEFGRALRAGDPLRAFVKFRDARPYCKQFEGYKDNAAGAVADLL